VGSAKYLQLLKWFETVLFILGLRVFSVWLKVNYSTLHNTKRFLDRLKRN